MWCVWLDGETVMVGGTMVFTGWNAGVCGAFRGRHNKILHFQLATEAEHNEHKHGCIILTHQPDNTRHDTHTKPCSYPLGHRKKHLFSLPRSANCNFPPDKHV